MGRLTRRTLVGALALAPAAAQTTPAELNAEFTSLYNAFVADMNDVMSAHIRGKWNIKLAGEAEKGFKKLTEHPLWLSEKKRRG